MMWDGWGGYGYGGMGWFGLMHLVWWLVLIAGGAAVIRWIFGGGHARPHGREDRAEGILRERYARGEIDQNEFNERLGHLKR